MSIRILVADRDYIGHDLDYAPLARLGDLQIRDSSPQDQFTSILRESAAEVVVANRSLFNPELLKALTTDPRPARIPRLICLTATGTNTVDLPAARSSGIAVCNVPGYCTDAVAQHSFALVLELLNKSARFDALARSWHGRCTALPSGQPTPAWTPLDQPIHELAGKTWGIIGLGAIGRRVAGLAQAFSCKVVWTGTSGVDREEAWPRYDLDQLLATSDIVSIHSPVNERTRGLLTETRLRLMKQSALLVNVGRGGIVVEADLARVLASGHLAGAALDVLWPEPPDAGNPLFALPSDRLILTPHVAWAAVEARQRVVAEVALNIESWLVGGCRNRVD